MMCSEMARLDAHMLQAARDEALETARAAAAVVLAGFRTGAAARKKGVVDLVTEYDLRSEELVRTRLVRAFPDHAIVGEEGENDAAAELTWYVDPLDGTTNFVHGHPFFAVSLALCEEGEPVACAIVAPALRAEWSAARGAGATREGIACKVSTISAANDALAATGFPYDIRTTEIDNMAELREVLRRTQGVRRCGSAALDLAFVADGAYDVYWEYKINPWDVAGGALLVTEAGGRITDIEGRSMYPPGGNVLATNGRLHEEMLRMLRDAPR